LLLDYLIAASDPEGLWTIASVCYTLTQPFRKWGRCYASYGGGLTTMELKDGQYQVGLRLLKGADDALQQVASRLKRKDEPANIRRGIEEVEALLKKVKQELRIG
jgi:hypothetical protein